MKIDRWTERLGAWWTPVALIVGVALSFAVMLALSGVLDALGSAVLVLFGSALTFAALAIVPVDGERMHWPIGPAAVLSVFGWMLMVEAASLPAVVGAIWPILIVAFTAYEVYRHWDEFPGSTPATHA
jgi:hypothetical protein